MAHLRLAGRGKLVEDGRSLLGYESGEGDTLFRKVVLKAMNPVGPCCEREGPEETGTIAKAVRCHTGVEEFFYEWRHINHCFPCKTMRDTGEKRLTDYEKTAGQENVRVHLEEDPKNFWEQ